MAKRKKVTKIETPKEVKEKPIEKKKPDRKWYRSGTYKRLLPPEE